MDLSRFDARFRNDDSGAPAYPPAMLLTVVLCAYADGVVSSGAIERLSRAHVTFIALCGDTAPHCTTIAQVVSTLGADIAHVFAAVFAAVLAVCEQQGLIGRAMFAIDGVMLPSDASKRRRGTRADFARQATKLEAAAAAMLARHRAEDARPVEPAVAAKDTARRERLGSRFASATPPNSAPGSRRIPRTDAGPRVAWARATARTTRARSWPPARA